MLRASLIARAILLRSVLLILYPFVMVGLCRTLALELGISLAIVEDREARLD